MGKTVISGWCRTCRRTGACKHLQELSKAEPCEHTDLEFKDGFLHLVCRKCSYSWVAVGHCKLKAIHDISARGKMPRHPTRQAPGTRSDIA